jgi:hypothetical protein
MESYPLELYPEIHADIRTRNPILVVQYRAHYFVDKATREEGATREWIAMVENADRFVNHITTWN